MVGHLVSTLKDAKKVADITYRGIPEVRLFLCVLSLEDWPFGIVDGSS